jgi:hypothetical protein
MAATVAPLDRFDAPNHEWIVLDHDTISNSDEECLAECLLHESATRIQCAARARARNRSNKQHQSAHRKVPPAKQGTSLARGLRSVLALIAATTITWFVADQHQEGNGDESIKLLAAPEMDITSNAMMLFVRQRPIIDKSQLAVLALPSFPPPLELTWQVTSIQVLVVVLLAATALDKWCSKAARSIGRVPVSRKAAFSLDSVASVTAGKAELPPANPWNEFQRCVKGCRLDKKNVTRLYHNFKEAAVYSEAHTPSCRRLTPAALLVESAGTWKGFCAAVSGCGLNQEKMERLYAKAKSMSA